MLEVANCIVLDLETLHSADDCVYCGHPKGECTTSPQVMPHKFVPIGWNDKNALGLSIGCYWDYRDARIHWFDDTSLESTVRQFVGREPLLVSFNGIGFDFALMRALLRHRQEATAKTNVLCDQFKLLAASSYDILAEIWAVDSKSKFVRGLNSLDAIARANGLGAKLSEGAQAPRDWQDGKIAQVVEYNVDDVLKTKALFEIVCAGKPILRGDGKPITLPVPPFLSKEVANG